LALSEFNAWSWLQWASAQWQARQHVRAGLEVGELRHVDEMLAASLWFRIDNKLSSEEEHVSEHVTVQPMSWLGNQSLGAGPYYLMIWPRPRPMRTFLQHLLDHFR